MTDADIILQQSGYVCVNSEVDILTYSPDHFQVDPLAEMHAYYIAKIPEKGKRSKEVEGVNDQQCETLNFIQGVQYLFCLIFRVTSDMF